MKIVIDIVAKKYSNPKIEDHVIAIDTIYYSVSK